MKWFFLFSYMKYMLVVGGFFFLRQRYIIDMWLERQFVRFNGVHKQTTMMSKKNIHTNSPYKTRTSQLEVRARINVYLWCPIRSFARCTHIHIVVCCFFLQFLLQTRVYTLCFNSIYHIQFINWHSQCECTFTHTKPHQPTDQ